MIDQFQINNFRGFRELSLSGLGSVNVVVGKNASGKTALLEAIRLSLAGTPQALWQMNQARMATPFFSSRQMFEQVSISYFFDFDSSSVVSAELRESSGRHARLRMFFDYEKSVTSIIPEQPSDAPTNIAPLVLERTDFDGKITRLAALIDPQGALKMDQGAELGMVSEFLASNVSITGQQNASAFSLLSVNNREREIVDAMREEFGPLIENLAVLSPNQVPALYAVVPGLREKVPLSLLSSGINKLFAILAAMIVRSNGAILIDEIDNGFYYDRLEPIWRLIHRLAKKYNTQVFASTHSAECLRALGNVIRGNEADFTLLRAERNGECSRITTVKGEFLEASLEQGFEVR